MKLKVFVDTNVFVALEDQNDSTHKKAVELSSLLNQNKKMKFYTSSEVIGETLTVISHKLGKEIARLFIKRYKNNKMIEFFFDESMYKDTKDLFLRNKSKNISFVDCSSVITMRRAKINVIFSFDDDCDLVIAVGGGSALDIAKSINVLSSFTYPASVATPTNTLYILKASAVIASACGSGLTPVLVAVPLFALS